MPPSIILKILNFISFLVISFFFIEASAVANNIDETQRSEYQEQSRIERIIRNYLIENPEILIEVMQKLEARKKVEEQLNLSSKIKANRLALFSSKSDFIANPNGKIPVVEFFDYQCGYCKRFTPNISRLLKAKKYIRFIFKELPILGETSLIASKAALASRLQNKYFVFHQALMGLRQRLSESIIYEVAEDVGLDVAKLKVDMEQPSIIETIRFNRYLAQELGVRGTPNIIVGEQMARGAISYDRLKFLIEQARKNCSVC